MPPHEHRRKAQKELDKLAGVRAETAQATLNFGYKPTMPPSKVAAELKLKRETAKRGKEIKKILNQIGITKNPQLTCHEAIKFVELAKQLFGEHPQLLTPSLVSKYLGIDTNIVYRLARKGLLTHTNPIGTRNLIHFDRATLVRELRTKAVTDFLMSQVVNKRPNLIKMRRALIEKIQRKSYELTKQ